MPNILDVKSSSRVRKIPEREGRREREEATAVYKHHILVAV